MVGGRGWGGGGRGEGEGGGARGGGRGREYGNQQMVFCGCAQYYIIQDIINHHKQFGRE